MDACTWLGVSMLVCKLICHWVSCGLEMKDIIKSTQWRKRVPFLSTPHSKRAVETATKLTQCVWWWSPTSLAAWFVLEGSLPSGWGREIVGGCQDCCWWSYCKSLGYSASLWEKRKPKYHWWKHPSLWKDFHLRNHGLGERLSVERDLLQSPTTWVVTKTHKVKQTNFL